MKKRIHFKLIAILCMAMSLSVTTPALAATTEADIPPVPTQQTEQIMPLSEETVWVTRNYNRRNQKRLWSITKGVWLTDWIDI